MSKSTSRRRYNRGAHIYSRGGFLYAYLPERPKGTSLKTRDRTEAEHRFRALLANPGTADVCSAKAPEVRLAEIAKQYTEAPHGWTRATKNSYTDRALAFGTWIEKRGLVYASEITPAIMDEWTKARTSKISRRTLNRDLRVVRTMIAWAVERALCAPCVAVTGRAYVREAKRSKTRFVPDAFEAARVFDALENLHAGACSAAKVLYATGLRIEELRRLTPFDLVNHAVRVRPEAGPADTAEPTKGYRERDIPIAPEVEDLVKKFFAWRAGKGGMGQRVGCSESWLIKKLHLACTKSKVPSFGLHDMRAAFATEAWDRGVGLVVIQRWLGHADPATTQGYIRPRRSDAAVRAPVPGGLRPLEEIRAARAESVQKEGV